MASLIEIRTDKGDIDLLKDAHKDFYVTRQIHDLRNFNSKNADFTKTIKVPPTPKNIDILDAYTGAAGSASSAIPCQILMNGITIAANASLLFTKTTISNSEISYDVTILYGNFGLFDSILAGTIDEMNWADLAFNWLVPEYAARSQNTTDLCTPVADWNTRTSTGFINVYSVEGDESRLIDINLTGFFVYTKEILKRIINEAGFTLIEAANLPADYFNLALSCPVYKFFEITDSGQLSFQSYNIKNLLQSVTNAVAVMTFQAVPPSDINNLWNPGTNEWIIVTAGNLVVEVTGTFEHQETGVRPASEIRIMQNAVIVGTFSTDQTQPPGTAFFVSANITVIPGDRVWVQMFSAVIQTVLFVETGTQFSIFTEGSDTDRLLQPSEWIPQVDKATFLANILKLFNLVIQTDDISKEVTIQPFDDVYTGVEQVLSDQIDVGGQTIEREHSLESIGRLSHFKWLEDNLLRRDINHTITFDNQLLAKERTVIEMIFSGCDNSVLYFNTGVDLNLKAKLPLIDFQVVWLGGTDIPITVDPDGSFVISIEVDFQIGDFLIVSEKTVALGTWNRIIEKSGDTQGKFALPVVTGVNQIVSHHGIPGGEDFEPRLALLQNDGGEGSIYIQNGAYNGGQFLDGALSLTASWLDSLLMSNITGVYYDKILGALQTPQTVKAWFNIPTAQFVQLDFMRPIYIADFNGFYYLNKINQFKTEEQVQLELVRLDTIV